MKTQINEIKRMQQLAGIINEGFLDNVASSIKGKSEQGKLAQEFLAKMGITKNPSEVFSSGAERGGAGPFENEVQDFVENGGDINTKIPFSKNIKSSSGGAIFKETYTFDFNKEIPTMKSGGKFIWNIKGGKWEPFGDKDGNENQEVPLDVEGMKKETDAEPGEYATEAIMMTIADAAKIWPGGYGERLRDIIAEKSGTQPQAESLDQLDEAESPLKTFLTTGEFKDVPQKEQIADKIINYLDSVFVAGPGIPGQSYSPENGKFWLYKQDGDKYTAAAKIPSEGNNKNMLLVNKFVEDELQKLGASLWEKAGGFTGNNPELQEKVIFTYLGKVAPQFGGFSKIPVYFPAEVGKSKPSAQPQQESFDQLDEIVDKVLAKLRSTK